MIFRHFIYSTFITVLAASISNNCSAEDSPIWYKLEHADLVVSGRLHVSQADASIISKSGEPLILMLDIAKAFKGTAAESTVDLHFPVINDDAKAMESWLETMNGKDVIVFAYQVTGKGYYLDQYFAPKSVILSTSESIAAVSDTLKQANLIAQRLQKFVADNDMEKEVTEAIDMLASDSGKTRDAGVNQLVSLGCEAVPFMIKHMRDNRQYKGELLLKAPPSIAFEDAMHFYPKTVYDAVSHILTYVTGYSFKDTLLKEEQRDADYHGWLVYLANYYGAFGPDTLRSACN